MAALAINMEDVLEPSVEEIDAARRAARQLSRLHGPGQVSLVPDLGAGAPRPEPISLPINIFKSIVRMLAEMGNGNAVAVVPVQAELTTQQAADLLNVSRPHLIKLLKRGDIGHRMVGTHRKLLAREVLAYRDRTDHARRGTLAELARLDEELGLYDDDPVGSVVESRVPGGK